MSNSFFNRNAGVGGRGGLSADQKKTATASEAKDILSVGTVYYGVVQEVSANGTYTVEINSPDTRLVEVVLASPIMAGMLGFHDSRVLSVNTEVALVYGNPSFIFATFSNNAPDEKNGSSRSLTWGDAVSATPDAGLVSSSSDAEDKIPGEFDYDNLFGVGIRFLTSLIAMKAGDRAKVECHLLNDMVRIISSQFRHIHGLGDDLIFDYGRPTMERGYTSYRHELMGALQEGGSLFELNGDEIDKSTIDRVHAQARYRYLEYLGFAGDFIHRFVCDPPATLVSLCDRSKGASAIAQARESGRRAGKSWEHFGSDGSYILQSTAEIRFERVTAIPVFYRVESHESPSVTKARRYRELQHEFLKAWDYGSFDGKDAYRTAYQLRLYARWLSRYQAYARALQLDQEYEVPSEAESPTPDWCNAEKDRQTAAPNMGYYEAYSSYSILRDGSQILHCGYGASVVLSNGNVQISAPRHVEIEAAGDIRMYCGGSFFLKARRHIEMSASAGGILMHSFAFLRALCERGSVHLRSDAKTPDAATPDTPKAGVEPAIAPVVLDSAILLETPEGKMAIRSEKQISLTVEGNPDDADSRDEDTHDVVVSTKGSLRVRVRKYVIVAALRDIILSARHLTQKANKWYAEVGEILWGKIQMNPGAGSAQLRRVELESLSAQTSIACKRYRGPQPRPGAAYTGPQHGNHIGELSDDIVWKSEVNQEAQVSLGYTAAARSRPISPWEKTAEDAKWEFLHRTDYYWDHREERRGALVQTLTQQFIAHDNPSFWGGSDHYTTWNWAADRLVVTKRIGDNKIGFGGEAEQFRENGGDNLHSTSDKSARQHGDNAARRSWTTNTVAMHVLKHT